MTDNLKIFVSQNKSSFDTLEPSANLWAKIDGNLVVKPAHWIKSKSLAKFLKLGFGASVIVGTTYYVSSKANNSDENPSYKKIEAAALNNNVGYDLKPNNEPGQKSLMPILNTTLATNEKENKDQRVSTALDLTGGTKKTAVPGLIDKEPETENIASAATSTNSSKKDSNTVYFIPKIPLLTKGMGTNNCNSPMSNTVGEKTVRPLVLNNTAGNSVEDKKVPIEMNTYSGTLLDGYYCDVLTVYKTPGQVSFDGTMSNVSCSDLLKDKNLNGVWLKGLTDKPLILKIANNFKNIKLVKANGKTVYATAISDFANKGSVISYYVGKKFDITYKDKVEMILFFKGAEKGDKVVIDKLIEAVIN